MTSAHTLRIPLGPAASGNDVVESLLVEPHGGEVFRLLRSPGLLAGLAAGDLFRHRPDTDPPFEILERGGNVAVQIYHVGDQTRPLAEAVAALKALGGVRDDRGGKVTVMSVPVTAGFPAMEQVMARFSSSSPDAEWYFANVYDLEDGVRPLAWWEGAGE